MSRPIASVLKDNAVLIAGIALPVLLVLLFAFARVLPEKVVADPQYRAIFLSRSWNGLGTYNFDVGDDGKLALTYIKNKDTIPVQTPVEPNKILIFNGVTGTMDVIKVETPDLPAGKDRVTVPVKGLETTKLSKDPVAPDGYSFRAESYRSSSLITEVFTYHSSHIPNSIVKDSRSIPITKPSGPYYPYLDFLGWELK